MAVTNFNETNVAIYKITSAGAAYTLTLPFNPDCIEWYNYTKFGTDTNNIQGTWFNGFPAGDTIEITRGTTTLTSTLETTNGVTISNLPTSAFGFSTTQLPAPSAITPASPVVVTSASHGLVNGQWVQASDFISSPTASATGMYQLNNRQFKVGNVTTNTFALYDKDGVAIDGTTYTAFVNTGVAKFNLIGTDLGTVNPAPTYRAVLGSAVMGAASDVIYVKATKANAYAAIVV